MTTPHRTTFATLDFHGTADGVVHLKGNLPSVIAIGTDAVREIRRNVPPLGGPHLNWWRPVGKPSTLEGATPEAVFRYDVIGVCCDTDGWYYLMQRSFSSAPELNGD